jgi:hypothetical protein
MTPPALQRETEGRRKRETEEEEWRMRNNRDREERKSSFPPFFLAPSLSVSLAPLPYC